MSNRAEGINFIRIFCMLSILFHARTYYGFIIGTAMADEFISVGAVAIVGFFMMPGFCLRMQWRNIDIMSKAGGYFRKRLAGIYPYGIRKRLGEHSL